MDVKFDEGNVLQPDVLYISEQRKPELVKDIIEGAPDLVIEYCLPQTLIMTFAKRKTFIRNMV
jgi:Uma2 family endonuclease